MPLPLAQPILLLLSTPYVIKHLTMLNNLASLNLFSCSVPQFIVCYENKTHGACQLTGQVATPTQTNITCLRHPVWVKASLIFSVTLPEILAKILFWSKTNQFPSPMESNNSNKKILIKQFKLNQMVRDPGTESQVCSTLSNTCCHKGGRNVHALVHSSNNRK